MDVTLRQLFLCLTMLISGSLANAQFAEISCQMEDVTNLSSVQGMMTNGLLSASGQDFFAGNEGCDRVELDVNFIFLYKDDGTGNWDFDNPEQYEYLSDMLDRCKTTLEDLSGNGCPDDGSAYSGLEINYSIHQINQTSAWDLDQCNQVVIGDPCGSDNDLCGNTPYDGIIDNVISSINGENSLNVYFAIEGWLWHSHYENENYLTTCDHPDGNIGSWTGRFPNPYNLEQLNKSQIVNFYLGYLLRKNKPECFLDSNGIPYDPEDILDWFEVDSGRTLAHEIGHTLGLTHVNCDGNIMQQGSNKGAALSNDQVARINRSLAMKNARNVRNSCVSYVDCAYTLAQEEILRIDFDTWIDRDIIIETGAELTVEENLSMAIDAKIIVKRGGKLTVDGGRITSCGAEWKGIVLEGNGSNQPLDPLSPLSPSDAGIVILKNEAVIENARTGITCQKLGEDWNSDYYGGLIVAEDATFLNCGRGVAFMPYSRDLSSFTNVTFECEGTGVTGWNNHGVVFQECTFSGLSDSGIYGEDATVNIQNNCLFNDNNYGVYLDYSYQPISHSNRIGNDDIEVGNEFRDNIRDMKFSGAAHNNFIFFNQSWGASKFSIDMDGLAKYTIRDNSYFSTKDKSVRLYSTGGSESTVDDNEFVDHAHGIGVYGYNEETSFDLNCFSDAGVADIFVTQSDFANNIGNPATSAGNCFSNSPSSFNFIAYGTNAPFTYWEPDPTEGDACLIPTDLSDQFTAQAIAAQDNNCDGFSGFTSGESNFCEFSLNETNMDSMVTAIELSIQELEIDSTRSYQEELDLKRFKLCLDNALSDYVDSLVIIGDCDIAFALYNRQSDDVLRIKAYSVLLDCDRCQEAGLWLEMFTTDNSELQDYTAVQQINVKRLCNRRDFEPTEGELYHLYGLTQETHPYSAYARSLWHILTGESIFLPMPTIEKSVDKRSDSSVTSKWSLYPNPTSEQLTITFDRVIESGEIMITDNLGRCVDDSTITAQNLHRVDVTQYDTGIYYVRVSVNDRLEYIDKFVVK